jgi:hypothetical protein
MLRAFNEAANKTTANSERRSKMKIKATTITVFAIIFIACVTGLGYIASIAISGTANSQPPSPNLVPLEIALPKLVFMGTRQDVRMPNLEKLPTTPRPAFLAPAGAANLAAGKPVTSTDDLPLVGELDYITDGDKEATAGSYVELAPGLQSVTIDLGGVCDIYAIVIWHNHEQPRAYKDIVVQVADDADFTVNPHIVFNNDTDNSVGLGLGSDLHYVETHEGKLIDCLSQNARGRYVRLYSNGNSSNDRNHYTEVEVYGKPAQ